MGFLDIIPAALNFIGQQQTNSANAAQAQANRDFQAQQTGTQYQRAVADMTAAGINPMLASQVGGNAAAAGSMATMQNPMVPATSAYLQSSLNSSQKDLMAAQKDKVEADTATANSQTAVNYATVQNILQSTATSARQADLYSSQTVLNSASVQKVMSEIDNLAANKGLTFAQTDLVRKQAINAVLTGNLTMAETGNVAADTALKELKQSAALNDAIAANTPAGGLGAIFRAISPFSNSASSLSSLFSK